MDRAWEEQLIDRARAGDQAAQNDLWRANRRWVAAIVLAHRPRAIEVDDLMQEVAIKLITRIDTLREAGAFRPWLRQITINICRGAARSHRPMLHLASGEEHRDTEDASAFGGPVAMTGSTIEKIDTQDAAARLLRQALSLPPEYREPLLLRCLRSLSYAQIGEILNLPVTTIETRLARARRMLREEIGDEITGSEGCE